MTAAFWWYVLIGFIAGFCISTVWEWLYFRKRRMRITDRRIAELERALQNQPRGETAVEVLPAPGVTWTATDYQSPGVFLENERAVDTPELAPAAVTAYAATTMSREANGVGEPAQDVPPQVASTEPPAPEPADDLSAAEKAMIGAAAAGAAVAAAHALADDDEPKPEEQAVPAAEATTEDATDDVPIAAAATLAGQDQEEPAEKVVPPAQATGEDATGDVPVAAAVAGAAVAAAILAADDTPAEAADVAPPQHGAAATPPVTNEVRGLSARQGYIVSELSPGEFSALQATQKARRAARKAWEQARALTDFLRNA